MIKADVEFYHASEVLKVARMLSKGYDSLKYKARQKVLDKAVAICYAVLKSE